MLSPDPARVSATCEQDVPGLGRVPATLEQLGLSEAEAKRLIKAGVPVVLIDAKEGP